MNTQLIEAIPHRPEADSFDLLKSWEHIKQAVIGHKVLILASTLLTVSLMLVYIIVWPSFYKAEVIIMAEAEDDPQRSNFYSQWNVFRTNHLQDEVELINSRTVLEKTVDRLNLTYEDVYHPFQNYAAYLWGESWVGKSYRKIKYTIFSRPCEPNCPTEEERVRARTLVDFARGVALMPKLDSYVASVTVLGPSPRVAEIANTLIEVYLDERKLRYLEEAEQSYDSLKAESDKVWAELLEFEKMKEAYYTEQNILLEFEKDKVEVSKWLDLKAAITASEVILASMVQNLAEVERQLDAERKEVVGGRTYARNTRKIILRDQLVHLRLALNQTIIRFTPESPEVTDIEKQIAAVTQMIQEEEEMEQSQFNEILSERYVSLRQSRGDLLSQIAGVTAGLAVNKAAEAEMRESVTSIPVKIKATHEMGRKHSILESKYLALQGKLNMAAVSKATVASAPAAIKVMETAIPPPKPYWPKKKLFLLLALILGAFSGVMVSLVLDLFNQRVNRYYLTHDRVGDTLFAILRKDPEYLNQIFCLAPPPKPRLLTKLSR